MKATLVLLFVSSLSLLSGCGSSGCDVCGNSGANYTVVSCCNSLPW